ncbi:hypothetical protein OF83DRAFT_877542 [Amylostereum chailletii]|nr:hypothetical protein OF83DRAFT_877542 [Amylostereum chailletii]
MSSSSQANNIGESERDYSSDGETVKEELASVHRRVVKICNKVSFLQRENRKMRREIEALRKTEDPESAIEQPNRDRAGASTTTAILKNQVKELETQVKRLEKARTRDKEKIEQFKLKEIRADAKELEDEDGNIINDTPYLMRKLLRRFHDAMLATSLRSKAGTCAICLISPLRVDKCSSLHCQHIFCNDCLSVLLGKDPTSHSIFCPECRKRCARNEVEVVQYTAQQQWDELLDIAQEFAKMDRRGELETSEEEAEEEATDNFIDDGTSSSSAPTRSEHDEESGDQDNEESTNGGRHSTPSRVIAQVEKQLYSTSPMSVKRQRIEQLVEERNKKRRT